MQYYVVFFDEFCNLVPANWINLKLKKVLWPPRNKKFNKTKMHMLQPDYDWISYKYHKCLGPFDSLKTANQVEEHCINASTNEDTDDMCKKAVVSNKTENKRKRKKPIYLTDTSEEEEKEVTEATAVTKNKDKSPTISFVHVLPPPSHYQKENMNESFPMNPTIVSTPKHSAVDIIQTRNILESGSSCASTIENNKAWESSSFQESNNLNDSTCGHEITKNKTNEDKENLSASSKQLRIEQSEKETSIETSVEKVPNVYHKTNENKENLPGSSKQQLRIENRKRSDPMSEEQFLTYYKLLNTKLNHIINMMKDRGREIQIAEEEDLLPNFPLKTIDEFNEFEESLNTSLQVQNLYIREIKMIGGSNAGKYTRATLEFLMSNELALDYSWSGQKNTLKFRDTLISKLIVQTISKVKNVPKCEIETSIKKWLQHASDRLKKISI